MIRFILMVVICITTILGCESQSLNTFYCQRTAEERFCYTNSKYKLDSNFYPQSMAYCYTRSAITGSISIEEWWSRSELVDNCFPTLRECESNHNGTGTGAAGQPPIKQKCRFTQPNEHTDKIISRF